RKYAMPYHACPFSIFHLPHSCIIALSPVLTVIFAPLFSSIMRSLMRFALLFIFLAFGLGTAIAQNGKIKGFVYEKSTGEPVLFTSVYLKGTSYGAATDVN